jgi:hypothetical protein
MKVDHVLKTEKYIMETENYSIKQASNKNPEILKLKKVLKEKLSITHPVIMQIISCCNSMISYLILKPS